MPLASGTRLGPYEILAPIGSGGMGEVHRARDTKLGRDAAIKILPDAFAGDPERLSQFEREARTWPPSTILTSRGFQEPPSITVVLNWATTLEKK